MMRRFGTKRFGTLFPALVLILGALSSPVRAAEDAAMLEPEEEMALFVLGNTVFTLYHELGHALIDQLGIPVLGKEEDAVDSLATILLVGPEPDPVTDEMVMSAADGYAMSHASQEPDELAYWDEHSFDMQRYGAVNCLIYGADPEGFAEFALVIEMPEDQQMRCPSTFDQTAASWEALLDGYFRAEADGEDGGAVIVSYGDGGEAIHPDLLTLMRESGMIEDATASVEGMLVLPYDIPVKFEACDTINAFYDPSTGEVTMCYELVSYFAELIVADIESR
jgi:hypothetical protein